MIVKQNHPHTSSFNRTVHTHTTGITGLAYSPDGRLMASCSESGQLNIQWMATEWNREYVDPLIATLNDDRVCCVALSNEHLVFGTAGGQVHYANLTPFIEHAPLRQENLEAGVRQEMEDQIRRDFDSFPLLSQNESTSIYSVDISQNGERIAYSTHRGFVIVLHRQSAGAQGFQRLKRYQNLSLEQIGITVCKFSKTHPDLIAIGRCDGRLLVYDITGNMRPRNYTSMQPQSIKTLEWSWDREIISATDSHNTVLLFDVRSENSFPIFYNFPPDQNVVCAHYRFPSRLILTNSNHSWRLCDIVTAETALQQSAGAGLVTALLFSPVGNIFLTASQDAEGIFTVREWKMVYSDRSGTLDGLVQHYERLHLEGNNNPPLHIHATYPRI